MRNRLLVLWLVVLPLTALAQVPLAYCFDHPQDSARTKVWWFHGETVGTHEGITADLEAFKEKGVGGVVYYDQVHGSGEGASKVFSPEWWDELIFSSQEARRLGLSFEANCSNGYVAGGKWITPDKSMQSLVCTETVVEGGRTLSFQLPLPDRMPGGWHHDVAVLAVPYADALLAEAPMTQRAAFGQPFTARSITYEVTAQGKARTSSMQVPPSHFGFDARPGEFFGCGFRRLSSCVLPLPSCPWQVTFDPQMGGPSEPVTFDKLTDWTKNDDPRIRYYSGTAVYRNTLKLKKKDAQVRYLLNIGKLNGAAEVIVNGASAGIVWCSPWRIDVTRQLRKGSNRIEIRVANCLWNRLVGDALLPESGRIIRQTHPLAKPDDKLIPSGLTL